VKIAGAPADVAVVFVAVATAPTPITANIDLTVPAGGYSVTAGLAVDSTAPFRTAYEPSIDVATPCVRAGQTTTVTVTYAAIATSGKLWVGNSGAGKEMLGFAPASVAATGAHAADVAAGTKGSNGFTFDNAGNLWVLGATTADPPLARYRASTLGTSGAKTPDVTIDSPSFGSGIPGVTVVAFDQAGNLWVSVEAANKVVRFTPEQLSVTGTPTAAVEIDGINGPSGIAFNAAGSMFVSASGDAKIARFDKDRVYGSGTGAILANLMIAASTPGPVIGPLTSPTGLAFDTSGNLWVNFDGTLAKLTPDDFSGTGTKTVTPAIQIRTDVLSLPVGIAFDSAGALWLAHSAGKLARLDPSQLTTSGAVAPAAVITSSDLAYAGWFAIYPAPTGTGLFHALP
jgi:sugar lactone lactonase YvrE